MNKAMATSWQLSNFKLQHLLGLIFSVVLLALSTPAWSMATQCEQESAVDPHLILNTSAGLIKIRLVPDAAPNAVAQLIALVSKPVATKNAEQSTDAVYYYDGLTFNYTRPNFEVRTSAHPSASVEIPQEIDADALGLDEQLIPNVGEAMNVIQDELLPGFRNWRTGARSEQLTQWIKNWYEEYQADFLVGVSRKHINQALGYQYTEGLESRPVSKGSVSLKPISPHLASPILSIALNDLPQRTGRWTVVGEVVQGLDLIQNISKAPLDKPPHVRSRTLLPLEPVVINSIDMECR